MLLARMNQRSRSALNNNHTLLILREAALFEDHIHGTFHLKKFSYRTLFQGSDRWLAI